MALKIVCKICCGIDIHKNFVVACIVKTDKQGVTAYENHHFSPYTKGLKQLLKWLLDHNCKGACMESTGKYWIGLLTSNIIMTETKLQRMHKNEHQ